MTTAVTVQGLTGGFLPGAVWRRIDYDASLATRASVHSCCRTITPQPLAARRRGLTAIFAAKTCWRAIAARRDMADSRHPGRAPARADVRQAGMIGAFGWAGRQPEGRIRHGARSPGALSHRADPGCCCGRWVRAVLVPPYCVVATSWRGWRCHVAAIEDATRLRAAAHAREARLHTDAACRRRAFALPDNAPRHFPGTAAARPGTAFVQRTALIRCSIVASHRRGATSKSGDLRDDNESPCDRDDEGYSTPEKRTGSCRRRPNSGSRHRDGGKRNARSELWRCAGKPWRMAQRGDRGLRAELARARYRHRTPQPLDIALSRLSCSVGAVLILRPRRDHAFDSPGDGPSSSHRPEEVGRHGTVTCCQAPLQGAPGPRILRTNRRHAHSGRFAARSATCPSWAGPGPRLTGASLADRPRPDQVRNRRDPR